MLIRGYSDVSISRSGMRNDCEGSSYWGACFKLDGDVRELFPYVNGSQKEARYSLGPHTVKSHIIHIFNKLNVNDRTQAAVWAVQNGFL